MLEDDFTWVIRKAMRGLAMAPAQAAERAGLPESEVLAFSRGRFSETIARELAPVLGLDGEALARLPEYDPQVSEGPPFLRRLDLPFREERVNAWVVQEGGLLLLFDAGCDANSLARELANQRCLNLDAAFITHGHSDHVGGLTWLGENGIPVRGPASAEVDEVQPGEDLRFQTLLVSVSNLAGHADPALGYHVTGGRVPLWVPGDALFAGSIGGCAPEVYQQALRRVRETVAFLPDHTIILPGHGPATTIGQEKRSNPFIAGSIDD